MRISDWSSDVSSSDLDSALARRVPALQHHDRPPLVQDVRHIIITHLDFDHAGGIEDFPAAAVHLTGREKVVADRQAIGRASGTERVCQYGEISVVAVPLKKKKEHIERSDNRKR